LRITADTNLLVRAITGDHKRQSQIAEAELAKSEIVALTLPALCELAWVLSQGYKIASSEILDAIRLLVDASNVVVNRPAVEAGLAMLEAGGDFADGVIAYEGRWLGAETFVTFDKWAAKLMQARDDSVRLLS